MRSVKKWALAVPALALVSTAVMGAGAAWAAPGGFETVAWEAAPVAATATAADESYCIPTPGPGVKMTFYCDIKEPSTLWVYCQGVTIEVRLNVGRWAPSGSCPGYRGYRLVRRV